MPGSLLELCYESQGQQLVVWPRTVAQSRASDWAIMGEWPVLHQDNFENVKYIFSVINIDQIKIV